MSRRKKSQEEREWSRVIHDLQNLVTFKKDLKMLWPTHFFRAMHFCANMHPQVMNHPKLKIPRVEDLEFFIDFFVDPFYWKGACEWRDDLLLKFDNWVSL